MKKSDVVIGQVYHVKVSEQIVPVEIVSAHPNGGWLGKSLKTGREIRIKTAAKLRKHVTEEQVKLRLKLLRRS